MIPYLQLSCLQSFKLWSGHFITENEILSVVAGLYAEVVITRI